jgi:hypothetical protein
VKDRESQMEKGYVGDKHARWKGKLSVKIDDDAKTIQISYVYLIQDIHRNAYVYQLLMMVFRNWK